MNLRSSHVAIACLIPVLATAQVHKCVGQDGRTSYSEAPCDPAAKSRQSVAIPLTDDQGSGASPNTSKSMVAADRAETIRLMIGNGKIEEARAYAQTPEERAIVARAAPPKSRRQVTPTGELIDKVAAAKAKAAKEMGDTLSKAYKP